MRGEVWIGRGHWIEYVASEGWRNRGVEEDGRGGSGRSGTDETEEEQWEEGRDVYVYE